MVLHMHRVARLVGHLVCLMPPPLTHHTHTQQNKQFLQAIDSLIIQDYYIQEESAALADKVAIRNTPAASTT